MYIDPVVEEVRRNGAKLADECGGDIHRMAERLRTAQAASNRRLIRRRDRPGTPRTIPPTPNP